MTRYRSGSVTVYYLRNCTSTVVVENILDYDPYGKVLREFSNSADPERYVTTQHERDKETGYDYRGARFYDSDIARFLSVDPLGHRAGAWSTYRYAFDNPIIFFDSNGMYEDYYENEKGEVKWFDNNAPEVMDKSMSLWKNIGTSYVSFTGSSLNLNYQLTDLKGNMSSSQFSVPAVSGRPNDGGKFDYSIERQTKANIGPIPEGTYSINPQMIQKLDLTDDIIGKGMAWTQSFGKKVGGWPGGSYSWGMERLEINPSSVQIGDVIRSGFTIHVGAKPGSAGCIDLMRCETLFFEKLRNYTIGSKVMLKVDYSGISEPILSPFNSLGTGFR